MVTIAQHEQHSDHAPPRYAGDMSIKDSDVSLAEFEVLERAASEEVSVELINGRVYVVPVPDGEHDLFAALIGGQIRDHCPELLLLHERGMSIPAYREGRARTDGAVAPRAYFRDQPSWSDPSGVLMLVEITSGRDSDAEVDRVEKRDAYAQAAVPAYLLIDRHRCEATIFWAPADDAYTQQSTAKFGAPLHLPEPFGFDLDTTEFL